MNTQNWVHYCQAIFEKAWSQSLNKAYFVRTVYGERTDGLKLSDRRQHSGALQWGRRLVHCRTTDHSPTGTASPKPKDRAWGTATEMPTYWVTAWKMPAPPESTPSRETQKLVVFYGTSGANIRGTGIESLYPNQASSSEPQTMTWVTVISILPSNLCGSRRREKFIHHAQWVPEHIRA